MKYVNWFGPGYIPGLLYFQNGSAYTGSVSEIGNQEFRYKISPKDGMLFAEVWYGPFCHEKSEIADYSEHSMDSEGRTSMIDWLKSKYESMIK